MTFLVSASSHTPFTLKTLNNKESKINIDVGKYEGTQFGDYLKAANYADYAFGIFVNELKEKNLYDDSVILVFGDHYGPVIDDEEMEDFIREINPNYNKIQSKINYVNVLAGIKVPGMQNIKLEKVVSKIDIKPTLLELSGIKDDFSLGKNIFGSSKDIVSISNGDIVTDKYYYSNDEWYYIETGETLQLESLEELEIARLEAYTEITKLELDISHSIAINNLLK